MLASPVPNPALNRNARGFTLLELTMAAFVLALSVLALTASMVHGNRLAGIPQEQRLASDAIEQTMAEITVAPYSEGAARFDGTGFEVPGLHAPEGDADGLPGEIAFGPGPGGSTAYYTVTVRVRWQGQGGARSLETARLLANIRGESVATTTTTTEATAIQ